MKKIEIYSSLLTKPLTLIFLFILAMNLFGIASSFMFGHDHLKGLIPLFNMTTEQNIPTFFTSLLLIIIAIVLAITRKLNTLTDNKNSHKWAVLSLGFLLMAYDESFQLHELFVDPMRDALGNKNLGIFHYAWVIPGVALVAFLGLYFSKFLLNLPAKTRICFIASGLLYIGGAIGMEMVGGTYKESYGTRNAVYYLISTVEESMEISGLIFFLHSLLEYIAADYALAQIVFTRK
jgi:hypothetical protein